VNWLETYIPDPHATPPDSEARDRAMTCDFDAADIENIALELKSEEW
jgi:hypothetical protein